MLPFPPWECSLSTWRFATLDAAYKSCVNAEVWVKYPIIVGCAPQFIVGFYHRFTTNKLFEIYKANAWNAQTFAWFYLWFSFLILIFIFLSHGVLFVFILLFYRDDYHQISAARHRKKLFGLSTNRRQMNENWTCRPSAQRDAPTEPLSMPSKSNMAIL